MWDPFSRTVLGLMVIWTAWGLAADSAIQWWGRRGSLKWPWVEGTFQKGSINLVITHPQSGSKSPQLEVWFSYQVAAEVYYGSYIEKFGDLPEAQQMLESMKQGPLFVRYKPSEPSVYFIDPYRDVRLKT